MNSRSSLGKQYLIPDQNGQSAVHPFSDQKGPKAIIPFGAAHTYRGVLPLADWKIIKASDDNLLRPCRQMECLLFSILQQVAKTATQRCL